MKIVLFSKFYTPLFYLKEKVAAQPPVTQPACPKICAKDVGVIDLPLILSIKN